MSTISSISSSGSNTNKTPRNRWVQDWFPNKRFTHFPIHSSNIDNVLESVILNSKYRKTIEEEAFAFLQKYNKEDNKTNAGLSNISIRIPFRYQDFCNRSTNLLDLLFQEPIRFEQAVKNCIYSFLNSEIKKGTDSGFFLDSKQIHIKLTLSGLPLQDNLAFDHSRHLLRRGLSNIQCVLTEFSTVQQYMWGSRIPECDYFH